MSTRKKPWRRNYKREMAAVIKPDSLHPAGSAYTMRLAALKGNIWEDIEEIDISEHLGLCDDFAAGAAKCLGLTKRTGLATRIIFVCRPNSAGKPPAPETPE